MFGFILKFFKNKRERKTHVRLTEEEKKDLLTMYYSTDFNYTQKHLSELFNVSKATVSNIIRKYEKDNVLLES